MRFILVLPWKLSTKTGYAPLCNDYIDRIRKNTPLEIRTPSQNLKNPQDSLQYLIKETKKAIAEGYTCLFLDENGKHYSTDEFSTRVEKSEIQRNKGICFIFGDAYGLPEELKQVTNPELFSLSRMTLAHELSLVVLLEQLYRVNCIFTHHPYHHGKISALAKSRQS